jgi:hypothetical protein
MSRIELIGGDVDHEPTFVISARPPSLADFDALTKIASPGPTDADVAAIVALAEAPLEIPNDEDDEGTGDDDEHTAMPEESSDPLDWPDRMRTHVGVPMESPQQRDRRTDARRGHTPPNLTAGMTMYPQERRVLTASGDVVEGGWEAYLLDEDRRRAAKRQALTAASVPATTTFGGSRR